VENNVLIFTKLVDYFEGVSPGINHIPVIKHFFCLKSYHSLMHDLVLKSTHLGTLPPDDANAASNQQGAESRGGIYIR